MWEGVEEDIPRQCEEVPVLDIWKLAGERLNPSKYRPPRIADAEIAEVAGGAGAKRCILRNADNDKYASNSEENG